MGWKAAVFDVDGTLLDTAEGVMSAVKYAINTWGLPPLGEEELKAFIGPPVQNSFVRHYGMKKEEAQQLADIFRRRYKDEDLLKAAPYEGIYQVFEKLKGNGILLAVATYKRQDYARRILEHFGFHRYTDILYGADNQNKLKKKDIIEKCLNDLGIHDYSQAVMVGDSDNDAVGAEELGMGFIGVTYGFGFKDQEDVMGYHADGCAAHPEDIAEIILRGLA